MVGLARDHGTSVLLITHNLGLVSRYAQRALVLRQGKMVETGTTRKILLSPSEAYTKRLVEALRGAAPRPRRGKAESLLSACEASRSGSVGGSGCSVVMPACRLSTASISISPRAKRSRSSAAAAPERPRSAGPCCG